MAGASGQFEQVVLPLCRERERLFRRTTSYIAIEDGRNRDIGRQAQDFTAAYSKHMPSLTQ